MTFGTILSDLYQRLGYATTPASEVTTRLKTFVNQAHRQLLSTPGLDALRDGTITFASVANQESYGLPPIIGTIQAVTEHTTNIRLVGMSRDELRAEDPGLVSTGTPSAYVFNGQQAVAKQPSAAAEIFVKSTSASDTGTAYLEGVRTGGYPVSLSVTMTGTTAVSFGAAYTDLIEITKVYLSTAAVGTVTVHQTSGAGTELARIAIGQTFTRYQAIQLWPTPAAAITYYVDYMRIIPDLANTTDEPLLPNDFHWMLVEGALISEWAVKDDDRRLVAERAYAKGLSDLKYRVACPPDYTPVSGGRVSGFSRLGGWFKSGAGVR